MAKPKRRKGIGFTNFLAILLMLFIGLGLAGGFVLARWSIIHDYLGSLICYTAAFSPVGTACGVVLAKIVDKSRAENTAGGVKYEAAKAAGFTDDTQNPPI
jgi:hypothetical protein